MSEHPRTWVPLFNQEAEESVLGAAMMSEAARAEALELLAPEDFYREAHQAIFAAVRDSAADPVLVADHLRRRQVPSPVPAQTVSLLERCGGVSYIHTLVSSVPSAANVAPYAKIVHRYSRARRYHEAAVRLTQALYEGEDPDAVATAALADIAQSMGGAR